MKRYYYNYLQTIGTKTKKSHRIRVWEVDPLDMRAKVVKMNLNNVREKYLINAGFFWWSDKARTKPYSLSFLASEGKILANVVPHNKPTGCLCIYKDGSVDVHTVLDLSSEKDLWFAIGGYTCIPFNYKKEGFTAPYNDVIRETKRVALGYNLKKHKIIIIGYSKMSAARAHDCLKELGCECAICIDAGGSAVMKESGTFYLKSDGRRQFGCIYINSEE